MNDETGDAKQRISSYPLFLATLIEKLDLCRCFTRGQHFPVLVYRLALTSQAEAPKRLQSFTLKVVMAILKTSAIGIHPDCAAGTATPAPTVTALSLKGLKSQKNQNEKWSLVSASATISYKVKKN